MKYKTKLDYEEIGMRIQMYRKKRKLTQGELGAKLGITSSQVSHIETALTRPSLDVVAGICTQLGVSADELIFGSLSNLVQKSLDNNAVDNTSAPNTSESVTDETDTSDFSKLGNYLIDCPQMDQEVILDMVSLMKKGLLAARLNAYNTR